MTTLAMPGAHGLGSQAAESVFSLIRRTAAAYQVKVSRLTRLAIAVARRVPCRSGASNASNGYISCSDSTLWLVSGLEMLSGRKDLRFSTLLPLRDVLGPRAHGIVSPHYRVCAECLHPATGLSYEILAHQLLHVRECPVHGSTLFDTCSNCGKHITDRIGADIARCPNCMSALWKQSAPQVELSRFATWCQEQALDLVSFISNPDSKLPDDWGRLYVHSVTRLNEELDERYVRQEKRFIRNIAEHSVVARGSSARPSFHTLLRLASIQAVQLVDFLQAPIEHGSPRLLDIGGAKDATATRRTRPADHWKKAKQVLDDFLSTGEHVLMPSKAALLSELGLGTSGFWQHFPELSVAYERERRRRALLHKGQTYKKTLEAAIELVRSLQLQGCPVHVRQEGVELMAKQGVSKHTAEMAIHAAIETVATYKRLKQGDVGAPQSAERRNHARTVNSATTASSS